MPNLRQMEIVTDVDKLNVDLQATLMKYRTIKQWAYIVHDKDDTRAHYHIYLNFGTSSVDTSMVASWFQIPENFINKVKGRKTDMLLYLTHGNDSQKNKYQYSPKEVVANFDFETEITNASIIGDFKNFSYAEMLQYANTLPISEKIKALTQLEKLYKLECHCQALNSHRDIQVMFITGKAGTGKTYYAKKFLESMKYDYCMSSSSNDIFQDYKGQRAIILDDLRGKESDSDKSGIEFIELLKMLDNNTQSSVYSRFQNKVFVGKMIVLTSSVPIQFWYRELRYNHREDLSQLYRRISSYVVVTETEVKLYDGLNEDGSPLGTPTVYENEIPKLKREQKKKFDFKSAFDNLFNPMQELVSDADLK